MQITREEDEWKTFVLCTVIGSEIAFFGDIPQGTALGPLSFLTFILYAQIREVHYVSCLLQSAAGFDAQKAVKLILPEVIVESERVSACSVLEDLEHIL